MSTTPLSTPPVTFITPTAFSFRSFTLKNPISKPYPNRASPLPCISSHFAASRNRRNYLRQKISERHQVSSSNIDFDSSDNRFQFRESLNNGNDVVVAEPIQRLLVEKCVGPSLMLTKSETWADQYKKDVELWGVGSNPIFTVFEDLSGNLERVLVDEDEIRARCGLQDDLKERILHARLLAKALESGNAVIARNSTVANFVGGRGLEGGKFVGENTDKIVELDYVNDNVILKNSEYVEHVEESGLLGSIRTIVFQPVPKLPKFGIIAFCGCLALWTLKNVIADSRLRKLTTVEKGNTEEKLKSAKVSVELVDVSSQAENVHIRRPKLDKQELLKKMSNNKKPGNANFQLQQSPSSPCTEANDLEEKSSGIRDTDTHSKEMKENNSSLADNNKTLNAGDEGNKMFDLHVEEATTPPRFQDGMSWKAEADIFRKSTSLNNPKIEDTETINNSIDCDAIKTFNSSSDAVQNDCKTVARDGFCTKEQHKVLAFEQDNKSCVIMSSVRDGAYKNTSPSSIVKPVPEQTAPREKFRIMKSVQEARDYLSRERDKQESLHNHDDLLPKVGVISSWQQSESRTTGNKMEEAANSEISLSQNISALPVALHSMGMMGDSQPNKKTDDNINNDIGQKRTVMKNQHPHQDDDGTINESTFVLFPQTGTVNYCSSNGNVGYHTDFSEYNVAHVLDSDTTEEMKDSQPIGSGNPNSYADIDKMQQSLVSPKYMDPGDRSSAVFVNKEPPLDHETIFSQKGTLSNFQSEDDGYEGAIVSQDGTLTQIYDGDSTPNKKENEPAKGLKHAASSGFDTPVETFAPSKINQTAKQNSVTEPPRCNNDNWLDKNFSVLDPVVAKIRDGFRENYKVAQEKTDEVGTISDLSQLKSIEDDHELEWMKDDHLRDIVFKVRDNELSGREPFHMMSDEDRAAFFDGLQKIVEQENKKLLKVHEYVHSNVENLNYGADGISIYDPLEKVIPRWKGPPIEKGPKFLSTSVEQKGPMVNGNVKNPLSERSRATTPLKAENGAQRKPKIVIEGSDGSVKPGKKNAKEFWQHTKKWSHGFLELYNAETDPEMKATMKDIGKDLDRWITEEEIQEAAELIDQMPERNKAFIQKKVEKIKREMELFGPQAVVSKYREYSEEKEEDYLWWLDLPYVLCIEMYTNEGGDQRVGFYSLEMAADLELEPKPCHVIAFEDSKDCKNMCYIIQAHLEMLGSGLAFVVAQPPKDTFRESKANGFNVTVIRNGELSLNVDQMLEEVEEQIVEIGSKMYHDQIMKDRSVDMNALMKGVIGDTKPIKRKRVRRTLKNFPVNRR